MKVRQMARCALAAALLCLCGWISIPTGDVAFTLQTFGVALTLWLLGGKWGSGAVFVYLFLGAAGLPVFSGFQGGVGCLLGATGGYLMGFLVWALVCWLLWAALPPAKWSKILAMAAGLFACYAFGTWWFCRMYLPRGESVSLGFALIKCVLPYLLPDGVKLAGAYWMANRLSRHIFREGA